MRIDRKRLFSIFVLITVLGYVLWNNYVLFYWQTDKLYLYQKGNEFRLCDSTDNLLPVWAENEEFFELVPDAEKAVSRGEAITIIARGKVDPDESEVHVIRIIEIVVGINETCEKAH